MTLVGVSEKLFWRETWNEQTRQSLFPCIPQCIKISVSSKALEFSFEIVRKNFVEYNAIIILLWLRNGNSSELVIVVTSHQSIIENYRVLFINALFIFNFVGANNFIWIIFNILFCHKYKRVLFLLLFWCLCSDFQWISFLSLLSNATINFSNFWVIK